RVPEPVISGRKDRFAYSLILIHFRKILNPIKIGSWKNSHPVIYHGYYIAGYYYHDYFSGQLLMMMLIIAG
ncbi:hypothetical protein ACP0G4_26605, partial [Escherichia coli]